MEVQPELEQYIKDLTGTYLNIQSIWLFGSRANGSATDNSDWDLLVFANNQVYQALQENTAFHNSNFDVLIVIESAGTFKKPWGRKKAGSLMSLEWKQHTNDTASYLSIKFIPDPHESHFGEFQEERLKALKLFERGTHVK